MGHPSAIRIEDLVEHRDWAVRLARSLVGDRGEPEGLVQDALAAAWQKPPGDVRDVRAWFGALLRRRAATELRAKGRREEHEAKAARAGEGEAVGDVLMRADMHRRLVNHILELPEPEARALLARYFDGQSPSEIARHEGCAISTVHNRLTRARGMLRERLDGDGGHPHWMSALAAVPVKQALRTAGSGVAGATAPWVLAVGSKLAATAVAAAAILALVFLRPPVEGLQAPPPAILDGAPVIVDLEPEAASEERAAEALAAAPDRLELTVATPMAAPDDGLFHGQLVERVGEELRPLAGAASLQIAAAADVEVQELDGERAEILMTSYVSDGPDGFLPVAMTGEPHEAQGGDWTMPVPENDLLLLDVDCEGQRYRPAESQVIPAGAGTLTILVEPVEVGSLVVTNEAGHPITSGISVRSGFDIPNGRTVRMIFPFSVTLGDPSDPNGVHPPRAPEPRESTAWIAKEAASPVAVPAADYLRVLWVGKDGYQWEKLEWPAGAQTSEVTLRELGNVEIEVLNRKEAGGAYQLALQRARTLTVHWKHVTKDGVYRAEGIGAGSHVLSISRKTASYTGAFHSRPVEVVAGQTTRISVDLAAVTVQPTGKLRIEVVPPLDWADSGERLMLSYGAIESGGSSVMGARHLLRNLVEQDGQRVVAYPGVPVGRYAVEVESLGAIAICEVIDGEETTAKLDLSELAEIEILPLKEGPDEAAALEGVNWSYARAPETVSAMPRSGASKIYPVDGRWVLQCVPGEIILQGTDADGAPKGVALYLDASPGRQRVELDIDPTATVAARLRVTGIPEERYWGLATELQRAIHAALKEKGQAGRAILDLRQVGEGLGRMSIEGYLALPAPDTLALNLSAEWRERLEGAPTEALRVEGGKPGAVRWSWRDDAPK